MTKSLLIILFLFFFTSLNLISQEKTKKNNPMAGIIFGANMPSFSRSGSPFFKFPSKNPTFQWQAGFSIDVVNTKKYGLKYEMVYNNKGASEVFEDLISTKLNSKVNLAYVQANLFPLIYKPLGNRKFNPYLALGSYFAYLVKSKYQLSINSLPYSNDGEAPKNTLKTDYGLAWSVGFEIKKLTFEYRNESGVSFILNQQNTLSSIKNVNNSFVLTVR